MGFKMIPKSSNLVSRNGWKFVFSRAHSPRHFQTLLCWFATHYTRQLGKLSIVKDNRKGFAQKQKIFHYNSHTQYIFYKVICIYEAFFSTYAGPLYKLSCNLWGCGTSQSKDKDKEPSGKQHTKTVFDVFWHWDYPYSSSESIPHTLAENFPLL